VLSPGGEPAANATVFLCIPQAGVTIDGPAHVEKGINTSSYLAQTDDAGRFSLPAVAEPQGIVVVHDQGYAQVSPNNFGTGGTITLQPWGRIEGNVVLDSQPVPNERIVAVDQVFRYDGRGRRFGLMTLRLETKTDPAGKFSFEKMPPGQFTVFRERSLAGDFRAAFESHETAVGVEAGGVTQVVLGGGGRPVIGTARLAGVISSIDWQSVPVRLRLKLAHEPGPLPRRHELSSNEAFIVAMDQWDQAKRAQRTYGTFCNSNGSFRLQDIPAGTYELEVKLIDAKPDSVSPRQPWEEPVPEIGSIVREVFVPEVSEGQPVEPLDLGTLELLPRQERAAGY
jgi:hypothetical protein